MISLLLVSISLAFYLVQDAAPGEAAAQGDAVAAKNTPEQALRNFMLALMTQDQEKVRALTLPHDELGLLLKAPPPPAEAMEALRAQVEQMPIKALKAGDEITLPGGRKVTVTAEDVGDDRAVLQPAGWPVPTRAKKVEGRWRVDVSPLIAARKAAAAAQEKAK